MICGEGVGARCCGTTTVDGIGTPFSAPLAASWYYVAYALCEARRGDSGLAARVVARMASDAETVMVEVARLTIRSRAWCAYELRTSRVPDAKYLTSDKKCVAVAASVNWAHRSHFEFPAILRAQRIGPHRGPQTTVAPAARSSF